MDELVKSNKIDRYVPEYHHSLFKTTFDINESYDGEILNYCYINDEYPYEEKLCVTKEEPFEKYGTYGNFTMMFWMRYHLREGSMTFD